MSNTLKKFIFLFLGFLIVSCNAVDDDNNTDQTDPIIGFWEYSTQFFNDVQSTATDCQVSTLEFTASGNRTNLYYDDNSGNCILVDTVNMTWEFVENDTYEFIQDGFAFTETVTFENGNNTVTFESSDSNGTGGIDVFRFVYNRVN